MCGIAGVVTTFGNSGNTGRDSAIANKSLESAQSAFVQKIVESQKRRGPDASRVESFCCQPFAPQAGSQTSSAQQVQPLAVTLGHNRLSIIDPDPQSHQPMFSADNRLVLSFNGEIYNYRELRAELAASGHWKFRTASDTEVILAAYSVWGIAMLHRLNGMFAFALYDRVLQRVYLVRDRFGVKPLLYHIKDEQLVFASSAEVMARRLRCDVSQKYVDRGLRYGTYDGGAEAPYAAIRSLPPGHYVALESDPTGQLKCEPKAYYVLSESVALLSENLINAKPQELVSEFAALFDDAVSLRLRADAGVALSLSGGVDSSSIAAVASAHADHLAGYSLGNPLDRRSEGPLAQMMAGKAGMNCHFADASNLSVVDAFWETFDAQEAPFCTLSVVAQNMVYRLTNADGVRVLLGGQGADEALMGYRKYPLFYARRLMAERKFTQLAAFVCSMLPALLAEAPRLGHYIEFGRHYSRAKQSECVLRLEPCDPLDMGDGRIGDLRLRSIADFEFTSLPSLLRYEDRNSMYHSIESRLPFMDYRLVELMIALPVAMKLSKGYGKWILRQAMAGHVPDQIRCARFKRGFDVPHSRWISAGLGQSIRDALNKEGPRTERWLSARADIDATFSDQELKARSGAFGEAVSLLWLSRNALN